MKIVQSALPVAGLLPGARFVARSSHLDGVPLTTCVSQVHMQYVAAGPTCSLKSPRLHGCMAVSIDALLFLLVLLMMCHMTFVSAPISQ